MFPFFSFRGHRRFSNHFYIKLLVILVLFVHVFFTPIHRAYTEQEFEAEFPQSSDVVQGFAELRQLFAESNTNIRNTNYDNLLPHQLTDKLIIQQVKKLAKENDFPTILWWSDFIPDRSDFIDCGKSTCILTRDRSFLTDDDIAIVFYGSSIQWDDLPLPRTPGQTWGLLHDESSKNNIELNFIETLSLFNYTSTFSRHSDVPMEAMFLPNSKYLTEPLHYPPRKDLKSLAPVLYIHSDCQVPSYRDFYTHELMKYIPVDSYGKCLNNKKFPDYLEKGKNFLKFQHEDLYKFIHGYKFTLAFENSRCDDYITEKLWRPLHMGSIPIYHGAKNIRDWVPAKRSVIFADDFDSPRELAEYLRYLESNQTAYDAYFAYKKGAPLNPRLVNSLKERDTLEYLDEFNMVKKFDCFICEKLNENMQTKKRNKLIKPKMADITHYNCEIPKAPLTETPLENYFDWYGVYKQGRKEAKQIRAKVLD